MIGVTLRYKWITWAMFMGPGLEPVLPSGRLIQKMYTYHLDWAPWSLVKTQSPLGIILKKRILFHYTDEEETVPVPSHCPCAL